jgi:2Fe-2S ferredoxin
VPRVRIEPSGIEIDVPAGETMMRAARAQGLYWPNTCDMKGRCATCFVIVQEGTANLSSMRPNEREALVEQRGRRALEQPVRLACQASVSGDLVVRKPGVRPD